MAKENDMRTCVFLVLLIYLILFHLFTFLFLSIACSPSAFVMWLFISVCWWFSVPWLVLHWTLRPRRLGTCICIVYGMILERDISNDLGKRGDIGHIQEWYLGDRFDMFPHVTIWLLERIYCISNYLLVSFVWFIFPFYDLSQGMFLYERSFLSSDRRLASDSGLPSVFSASSHFSAFLMTIRSRLLFVMCMTC